MPYNTAPIPPRKEATGTCQLPLSRVKKMIAVDGDINACSSSAAFVITVATEMFVQLLTEQAHAVVRSEKKPRRNIQYRDLANAVSHHDNLEFLVDIVPKTMPYKEAKKLASSGPPKPKINLNTNGNSNGTSNGEGSGPAVEAGQTTLDGLKPVGNGNGNGANGFGGGEEGEAVNDADVTLEDVDEDEDPNAQLEKEARRARLSTGSTISEGQQGQDVEMS